MRFEVGLDAEGCLHAPQFLNLHGTLPPRGRGAPFLARKIPNRIVPKRSSKIEPYVFGEPGTRARLCWLTGAATRARRDVFERLGLWDSCYFFYCEDAKLAVRARSLGVGLIVNGQIDWVHGRERTAKSSEIRPWVDWLVSRSRFHRSHPRLLAPLQPFTQDAYLDAGSSSLTVIGGDQ